MVEQLEAAGIPVDSLGACRNNKRNPFNHSFSQWWEDFQYTPFWDFEQRYKFAIGLENCRCEDYVTEKLFRRLVMGIVPIYEVGRNGRWVPEYSVLDPSAFASTAALAAELLRLDADDAAYERHLAWKQKPDSPFFRQTQACFDGGDHTTSLCALCEAVRSRDHGDSATGLTVTSCDEDL